MIWPFSTIAALRAMWRTEARMACSYLAQLQDANAAKMEISRRLAEACRERDEARKQLQEIDHAETLLYGDVMALRELMKAIAAAGAASKNGTARKLARMAGDALE